MGTWLTVIGLVVAQEQGLGWVQPARTIPAPLEGREQWCGVYYQDKKIGFTHTTLMPAEQDGIPGVALSDHGHLEFALLGQPQRLAIRAHAFIDADRRLRRVRLSIDTETSDLTVEGRRIGETLVLTITGPQTSVTQRLSDAQQRLWVGGLSSWTAFHHLRVGQRGRLAMINPLALAPEPAEFVVRGTERLGGVETFVVDTSFHGLTSTTWVTPDGVVVKERSPMGWELRQEDPAQAIRLPRRQAETVDLLALMAVPLEVAPEMTPEVMQALADPARVEAMTIAIEGVSTDVFRVDRRPWQTVVSAGTLQLRRPDPTLFNGNGAPVEPRHQAASPFVQADHPAIRDQARAIIEGHPEGWARVSALADWVHRALAKRVSMSFPSALDVLTHRTGDCHEHTVLFTALARSVGMPTRMIAGVVWYGDRFYYHAWPEVWLGGWMPIDPTLGQATADVTHLGVVEAEGEELVRLAPLVGQMRIRVLSINATVQ